MLLLLVAMSFTALGIVAFETDLLRSLELSTVNTRFQIRGPHRPPADVVLVEIDATTFSELNYQWPFPRSVHGQVIERIAREHPKVIAYDVQFTEASSCPASPSGVQPSPGQCDQARSDEEKLLAAINNTNGRAVMSTTETDQRGNTRFLGTDGAALLHEVESQPANALLPTDPGGVLRRVSYDVGHLKTLAVVSAEVASRRPVRRGEFGGATAWIDYSGPDGTFKAVPFSEVFKGTFPPGLFHNKVVVVGASAPSLHDISATSTSAQMPGAEIQANAIETVLSGLPLRSIGTWVSIVLIVLAGCLIPLVGIRAGPPLTIAVALAAAALLTIGAQLAFNSGRIVPFVYTVGVLVLSTVGTLSVQLITIAFERERVRDLFSRFVPENVVDEVLASADDGLRLGGVQREGTVMFTDLRGFTSFAESLTPDGVIEVLNRYLSEMSDAILDHGGTLVAYMGDGIMAVFGAPIAQDDHADRALACAREMLEVRLPRFNAWLQERGLGSGFRMGIGLNSGRLMSGNVGSERRVEYTAVGDATNVAARIEQLTKGTPHQLMLSAATKEALIDPPEDLVFVEEVGLRGRRANTSIWSLPEAPAQRSEPAVASDESRSV
ncbi:MAG TPA: adenylate/guanylate cyclase domain-containing protein [Solirubrobacteraceae bacterium]|jgi:adenylate cyclase|nr:adenylate/guanylate cyclase domain-containing protein [Solirubrobacteraceae bacterium]